MAITQYTIRNIPSHLDARLKKQAKKNKSSLNSYVIELLSDSVGVPKAKVSNNDLDWFIGSSNRAEQSKFRNIIKDARVVSEKDWL
jgi:hypothetical protein